MYRTAPSPTAGQREPERSRDAVDWIAGVGTEDSDGYGHIDAPLAVHHDQARAAFRAYKASKVLEDAIKTDERHVSIRQTEMNANRRLRVHGMMLAFPIGQRDGDAIRTQMINMIGRRGEPLDTAIRIGLGVDPENADREIPERFTKNAQTNRDGSLKNKIRPAQLAIVDEDGIHSAEKLDENVRSIREMTDAANAPRWAGGIGPRNAGAHTPDISLIVALGHTAEETAARLTTVARYIEIPDETNTKLTILPISRETGLEIQDGFVDTYPRFENSHRKVLEMMIGIQAEQLSEADQQHADMLAAEDHGRGDATPAPNEAGNTVVLWRHGRQPPEQHEDSTADTAGGTDGKNQTDEPDHAEPSTGNHGK